MPTIDASLSFRAKTLVAPGSRITVAVSLVVPTITASSDGVVGSFGLKTISAGDTSLSKSFVVKTLTSSVVNGNTAAVSGILPQKFLEPVGLGTSVDAAFVLTQKLMSAAIFSGNAISADMSFPQKTVEASYNPDAALQFLPKTISATVISGSTADTNAALLPFTFSSYILAQQLASVSSIMPILQASIEVVTGSGGQFDRLFPRKYITSAVVSGTSANVVATLPVLTLDCNGFTPNFVDVALAIPSLILAANVSSSIAAAFRAWTLNVRKQALSEYSNFNFNSLARFGDQVFAAGPDGLFALNVANDDDGTQIDASVVTGASDFGTSFTKRVSRIYTGYKSDGDMEFQTLTSQDGSRTYPLERNGITDIQQRRVIIGRGPKSRYWQFGITNRDGSDFELESVLVHPEKIRRRII